MTESQETQANHFHLSVNFNLFDIMTEDKEADSTSIVSCCISMSYSCNVCFPKFIMKPKCLSSKETT